MFWINNKGESPKPFTQITLDDFRQKKWFPTRECFQNWCHKYLFELQNENRFVLTIWPPHCLIGTSGHSVEPTIAKVLLEWELHKNSGVIYTLKGANSLTEHYSAIKAEVERTDDPRTKLNEPLLDRLNSHNKVICAGQALSHCVNFTCRDLMDNWKGDPAAVVLLEDCSSSVAGFENEGKTFLNDMMKMGVTITKSASIKI